MDRLYFNAWLLQLVNFRQWITRPNHLMWWTNTLTIYFSLKGNLSKKLGFTVCLFKVCWNLTAAVHKILCLYVSLFASKLFSTFKQSVHLSHVAIFLNFNFAQPELTFKHQIMTSKCLFDINISCYPLSEIGSITNLNALTYLWSIFWWVRMLKITFHLFTLSESQNLTYDPWWCR